MQSSSHSARSMTDTRTVSISVINCINAMLNSIPAEEASVVISNPQLFFEAVMRKCEMLFFKGLALQTSPAVVPAMQVTASQEERSAESARSYSPRMTLYNYCCSPCFSMLESIEAPEEHATEVHSVQCQHNERKISNIWSVSGSSKRWKKFQCLCGRRFYLKASIGVHRRRARRCSGRRDHLAKKFMSTYAISKYSAMTAALKTEVMRATVSGTVPRTMRKQVRAIAPITDNEAQSTLVLQAKSDESQSTTLLRRRRSRSTSTRKSTQKVAVSVEEKEEPAIMYTASTERVAVDNTVGSLSSSSNVISRNTGRKRTGKSVRKAKHQEAKKDDLQAQVEANKSGVNKVQSAPIITELPSSIATGSETEASTVTLPMARAVAMFASKSKASSSSSDRRKACKRGTTSRDDGVTAKQAHLTKSPDEALSSQITVVEANNVVDNGEYVTQPPPQSIPYSLLNRSTVRGRKLQCGDCEQTFTRPIDKDDHRRIHHDHNSVYQCNFCAERKRVCRWAVHSGAKTHGDKHKHIDFIYVIPISREEFAEFMRTQAQNVKRLAAPPMSTSVDGDDMPMLYQCEKCAKKFGRPEEQYACEREHVQAEKAKQSAIKHTLLQQTPDSESLPAWSAIKDSSVSEPSILASQFDCDRAVAFQQYTMSSIGTVLPGMAANKAQKVQIAQPPTAADTMSPVELLTQKGDVDRTNVLHSITDRLLEKHAKRPSTSAPSSNKYKCHPCNMLFAVRRALLEHANVCGRKDESTVDKTPVAPVKLHTPVVGRKMMAMREHDITRADDESELNTTLDTSLKEPVADKSKSQSNTHGNDNNKSEATRTRSQTPSRRTRQRVKTPKCAPLAPPLATTEEVDVEEETVEEKPPAKRGRPASTQWSGFFTYIKKGKAQQQYQCKACKTIFAKGADARGHLKACPEQQMKKETDEKAATKVTSQSIDGDALVKASDTKSRAQKIAQKHKNKKLQQQSLTTTPVRSLASTMSEIEGDADVMSANAAPLLNSEKKTSSRARGGVVRRNSSKVTHISEASEHLSPTEKNSNAKARRRSSRQASGVPEARVQ